MPIFVAGLFRVRRSAVIALAVLTVVFVAPQAARHYRAEQARQIVADLQKFQPAKGYALETTKKTTPAEENWKAYCYRERAELIEEARAQSQ